MSSLGTILVVEDDAAIARFLVEFLTEEGYTVQRASNGPDALTAFQADRFELALMDVYSPSLGGWELLSAVRAQQLDVPIVMMSTSTLATGELTAAGAQAGLYKPFELDELLACVARTSGNGSAGRA
jgi:two-component system copper resistance phosphate regulon response regulator CusR